MTDISGERSGPAGADVGLGLRPKNIGARVKRVEDRRLLAGQGMFTADCFVTGALHVAFRRSDHAHALISRIDTSAAAEIPGVFAIYIARDLDDLVEPVHAMSRMTDCLSSARISHVRVAIAVRDRRPPERLAVQTQSPPVGDSRPMRPLPMPSPMR